MNESAFPVREVRERGGHSLLKGSYGMDLRDYFAAKAMQGLIYGSVKAYENPAMCAEWAYQTADAMLKERAKSPSLH